MVISWESGQRLPALTPERNNALATPLAKQLFGYRSRRTAKSRTHSTRTSCPSAATPFASWRKQAVRFWPQVAIRAAITRDFTDGAL